ncbi:hypothetical protein HMF8227_02420 [Saliniradius amylolyticus]|uniref:RanBP2-type domain-containing protein n=1 Tax=Saliniradius amylolyticus TaxID=2183582 RepID=A0A2S2E5Q7_9ALTE|nr:DUF2007 domain-containing protein [Saliniradius amylolyticus]AWL12872.1 hypothetical protein HMF8227_02420 [Saliniradius amylolyticus]
MIRFYSHESRFRVLQVRDWLQSQGVPCFMQNEYASGAAGDLSPFDCWPELWLRDADWQPRAEALLAQLEQQTQAGQDWSCANCGEINGANFDWCWHCGHPTDVNND